MSLISPAAFPGYRRQLDRLLPHTYTRQAMAAGTEDAEGNTPTVASGSPVTGVACRLETVTEAITDEGGRTLVTVPRLYVSATDPLKVGDVVTNVTDSLGVVTQAGPFRVERSMDDTDGLGASLAPSWELRAGRVSA